MKVAWQSLQDEALQCLQDLIRLDTTNPPGNERIPGSDGSKGALLLSSHTDVVPVERTGWTQEPFSGEILDGCVWGRGAIDMKSKCAMDLAVMTAIKRAGAVPDRGVIMAAVADEEAGSDFGAKFLVERHPE